MDKSLDIDFYSPDIPKQATPFERKRKQVQSTIDKLLQSHPPSTKKFILEKLAIFGSRSLTDDRVTKLIETYFASTQPNIVITAFEPSGVCAVAQKFCHENKHPLQVHFLNIEKYARGAHEHRSDEVILASDAILFIHDGKSRGTYNEIVRAIKFEKPYFYERLQEEDGDGFFCNID